jgi:hypothetical protein
MKVLSRFFKTPQPQAGFGHLVLRKSARTGFLGPARSVSGISMTSRSLLPASAQFQSLGKAMHPADTWLRPPLSQSVATTCDYGTLILTEQEPGVGGTIRTIRNPLISVGPRRRLGWATLLRCAVLAVPDPVCPTFSTTFHCMFLWGFQPTSVKPVLFVRAETPVRVLHVPLIATTRPDNTIQMHDAL